LKISDLYSNRVEYYYAIRVERFLPDLSTLIRDGQLEMDGWIATLLDSEITIESSTGAIKDWLRYEGLTFGIGCYEHFRGVEIGVFVPSSTSSAINS